MSSIEQGSVVWAKGEDGAERRYRVVWTEGATLTLKRPGSDGGTFTADASRCLRSDREPSRIGESS